MRVSTKGRYGLRVMVDLAKFGHTQFISLRDIAKRQDISIKYLEQIMRMLTNANLVQSQRGSGGGYRLVRRVNEYTIKEIMRVCEGSIAPVGCVEDEHYCERCCDCATITFWKQFYDHMDAFLASQTLENIISDNLQMDYVI